MGQQFHLFHSPNPSSLEPIMAPSFSLNLSTILGIMGPLGIPWHPLSRKGHNFQTSFNYIGFDWDISSRTIYISLEKHLCVLAKLSALLVVPPPCINKKSVASIHESLQHAILIYQQGQAHLVALSNFLCKFPNSHALHHIAGSCLHQLRWWWRTLSIPNPSWVLVKLPEFDLDIWVDASTSWGIGLYVGGHWATWELVSGWAEDG